MARNPGDRALTVLAACAVAALAIVACRALADVLLIAFAGALFAVLLDAPASALARHTALPRAWSLALVIVLLAALAGGAGWIFGTQIADQLADLARRLPGLIDAARARLSELDWLIGDAGSSNVMSSGQAITKSLTLVTGTLGAGAGIVLALVSGIFFAAQPGLYTGGLLRLAPPSCRPRLRQVLAQAGHSLRGWLLGQACLMLFIGIASYAALALLGVEMPLALALVAGLLEFIPYLGPILGAVPALLVALAQDPQLALYVLGVYFVIQEVEGHVLQPLVQQRTIYLPPALVLLSQLAVGVLFGIKGLLLATPLTAAAMVAIRMLYVEDLVERAG